MYRVCTRYNDVVIMLAEFDTEKEAEEFTQHNYVLYYADEFESGDDEIIYPDEMFVEAEEIPFCEPLTQEELDDLPY